MLITCWNKNTWDVLNYIKCYSNNFTYFFLPLKNLLENLKLTLVAHIVFIGQGCSKFSVLSATPGLILKIHDNLFLPGPSLPSSAVVLCTIEVLLLTLHFPQLVGFSFFFHPLRMWLAWVSCALPFLSCLLHCQYQLASLLRWLSCLQLRLSKGHLYLLALRSISKTLPHLLL